MYLFYEIFLILNFRGIGPNDLALLKVKTPFTYTAEIQPVKLPEGYKIGSESLTLAGWGVVRTTVFFPDLPSKLQEVAVTYVPFQGKDMLVLTSAQKHILLIHIESNSTLNTTDA